MLETVFHPTTSTHFDSLINLEQQLLRMEDRGFFCSFPLSFFSVEVDEIFQGLEWRADVLTENTLNLGRLKDPQ